MKKIFAMALAAALLSSVVPAHAQVAAARPIRLIAPTTPGGGIDIYARLLAQELAPMLGPIIVENRPGAGTNIGTDHVAKSAPDGRTVLITVNTFAINAAVLKTLPFDPLKDLIPVTLLGTQPFVIGVTADLPVRDIAQLVALSKTPGSKIAYTSCGNGTAQHLGGELFKAMTGADMVHIPYKGCAPAIADVAGGQAQVSISPITTTVPHVQSGRIRALALTTEKRSPLLPGVPSAKEAGLGGYHADQWWGLFVPANTPREIIDRLNASVAKVLATDEVVKKLLAQGIEPARGTPEEFAKLLHSDIERWGKLAKAINLQLD
jgi:tripartite-type tricarboxylate transporter receptor subunit TctC